MLQFISLRDLALCAFVQMYIFIVFHGGFCECLLSVKQIHRRINPNTTSHEIPKCRYIVRWTMYCLFELCILFCPNYYIFYFQASIFSVCAVYSLFTVYGECSFFFSSFATNTATNFIPLHWYLMHFIFVPVVFILIYASGFNKIYYAYYFTQIFYRWKCQINDYYQ